MTTRMLNNEIEQLMLWFLNDITLVTLAMPYVILTIVVYLPWFKTVAALARFCRRFSGIQKLCA